VLKICRDYKNMRDIKYIVPADTITKY